MESIWSRSYKIEDKKPLDKDIKVEAAVIGAGMAGILTAYFLKQKGVETVVLEADRIGSGQTKNTTAKITMQHGYVFADLIKKYGEEKARLYADSQMEAVCAYSKLINLKKILCDFEEKPACIYEIEPSDKLSREQKSYDSLGIKYEFIKDSSLPFAINGALKINNQAQFNPLKFIGDISKELKIYEKTMVRKIENKKIITDNGNVEAEKIIIATHYPFINYPGLYFVKNHQERSYAIAVEGADKIGAMYRDVESEGLSLRNYKDLLIIGGEGHRTGKNNDRNAYETLKGLSKNWYHDSKVICQWSAQDCITPDKLPYIGVYSSKLSDMYILTGFQKWGMTNSMVGGELISDMIIGKKNKYEEIFYPQRFCAKAMLPGILADGFTSVKGLSKTLFYIPFKGVSKVMEGEGRIVNYKGRKLGLYRDTEGKIYRVTVKCPHLGCQLKWNKEEKTWDCPCHGSRFDYKGNLIDNPAMEGIKIKQSIEK